MVKANSTMAETVSDNPSTTKWWSGLFPPWRNFSGNRARQKTSAAAFTYVVASVPLAPLYHPLPRETGQTVSVEIFGAELLGARGRGHASNLGQPRTLDTMGRMGDVGSSSRWNYLEVRLCSWGSLLWALVGVVHSLELLGFQHLLCTVALFEDDELLLLSVLKGQLSWPLEE